MSRLVSNKTEKIDLGNGEWLEVKSGVTFAELEPVFGTGTEQNTRGNMQAAIKLLEVALVNWNLKEDDGTPIAFDKEMIKQLDTNTLIEVLPKLQTKYFPEKKA
jgi:hypothetical protein